MAEIIGIVGASGSGKSTGVEGLDPKKTLYINADKKSLPFRGWKAEYSRDNRNYENTSDKKVVMRMLKAANNKMPNIKAIVIDTINGIMIDDEMRRMREKGYDKWMDLAAAVYEMMDYIRTEMRDDIIVYLLAHAEHFVDDDGTTVTRILTNGKKLNKINLESKMTVVLFAKVETEDDGKNEHYFQTKQHFDTCKSPVGMFDEFKIKNDLGYVDKQARLYWDGEEAENAQRPEKVEE